jgi:Ca2+-binding RTX toxin-like protein
VWNSWELKKNMGKKPTASGTLSNYLNNDADMGGVSGAISDMYRNDNANVSITFAAPIAEIIGRAPETNWSNPKFKPTSISLLSAEVGGAVAYAGFGIDKIRDNGINVTLGAGVIAGGELTFSFPSIWPSDWGFDANGKFKTNIGVEVGALGMGLGGGLEAEYDEGAASAGGFLDLGILGFVGGVNKQIVSPPNSGPSGGINPGPQIGGTNPVDMIKTVVNSPNYKPVTGPDPFENRGGPTGYNSTPPTKAAPIADNGAGIPTYLQPVAKSSTVVGANGKAVVQSGGGNPTVNSNNPADKISTGPTPSKSYGGYSGIPTSTTTTNSGGTKSYGGYSGIPSSTTKTSTPAATSTSKSYGGYSGIPSSSSSKSSTSTPSSGSSKSYGGYSGIPSSSSSKSTPTSSSSSSKSYGGYSGIPSSSSSSSSKSSSSSSSKSSSSSSSSSSSKSYGGYSGIPSSSSSSSKSSSSKSSSSSSSSKSSSSSSSSKSSSSSSSGRTSYGGPRPVVLDLAGNGIKIEEVSTSQKFVDAAGDGLLHRTAWAAAGNAVLFFDPDGRNAITENRQYIFTEWDPTAKDDLAALRSVFDTNGDGKLTAADAAFAQFKLEVTNADGSTSILTLAQAGITEINLIPDATDIILPDGSRITGQATFLKSDGSTGLVANTILTAELDGKRIVQVISTDGSGNRVVDTSAFSADGTLFYSIKSVSNTTGTAITNSYDDDGDTVYDRVQLISRVVNGDGSKTETKTNRVGNSVTKIIVANVEQTITSANNKIITINRDSRGGGWFDTQEVRTTNADNSRTIVSKTLAPSGVVLTSKTESLSVDGRTGSDVYDFDGNSTADLTMNHSITIAVDGIKTESFINKNFDTTVRDSKTITVSADGRNTTVATDLDGNGTIDRRDISTIAVAADKTTSSSIIVKNNDNSIRNTTVVGQSADALSKTVVSDIDGNGLTDLTTVEVITIVASVRTEDHTTTSYDGTVQSKDRTILQADKVTRETWIDLNQNGAFETTDKVQTVAVEAGTNNRIETIYNRNVDGTTNSVAISTTASNGLTTTDTLDLNNDGTIDTKTVDTIQRFAGSGSSEYITTTNADGSLRTKTTVSTSEDTMTVSTYKDINGDGVSDFYISAGKYNNSGYNAPNNWLSYEYTYTGNSSVNVRQATHYESADRLNTYSTLDVNGDSIVDYRTETTIATNGDSTTRETSYKSNGLASNVRSVTTNGNGLIKSISTDANGDSIFERKDTSTTVLNNNGSKTTTVVSTNANGSLLSKSITVVTDDGLVKTTQIDGDGDGTFETVMSDTSVLNANGSLTKTVLIKNANTTLRMASETTISDDGLVTTTKSDVDGNATWDFTKTDTTLLNADGGTTFSSELRDAANVLRSKSSSTTTNHNRSVTTTADINGDAVSDVKSIRTIADTGVVTLLGQRLNVSGGVQSQTLDTVSANGLVRSTSVDSDGGGVFETTTTTTRVLNANGSVTDTTAKRANTGTLMAQTITTTSDDGFVVTTSEDWDGNNLVDATSSMTKTFANTGIWTTVDVQNNRDGSLHIKTTTLENLNANTTDVSTDLDGNTFVDINEFTARSGDGSEKITTKYFGTSGALLRQTVVDSAANGFSNVMTEDLDGNGTVDRTMVEQSAVAVDGTRTTYDIFVQNASSVIGKTINAVSDDGLRVTSSIDLNGDGVFEYVVTDNTVIGADSSTTQTIESRDGAAVLRARETITTSANGLQSTSSLDINGNATADRTETFVKLADGSSTDTVMWYTLAGALSEKSVTTTSADQRVVTTLIDTNGDSVNDIKLTDTLELDRTHSMKWQQLDAAGAVISTVETRNVENGTYRTVTNDYISNVGGNITDSNKGYSIFTQGDGTITQSSSLINGTSSWGFTNFTISADSLTKTSGVKFGYWSGLGNPDETIVDVTSNNANGSTTSTSTTTYADGTLRARSVVNVSADERQSNYVYDRDGNGVIDRKLVMTTRADGLETTADVSYNLAGYQSSNSIVTVSADGLTTNIFRSGAGVEKITTSIVDENNYTWDNGVAATTTATSIVVDHKVDGAGFVDWVMKSTVLVGATPTVTTYSVRLDDAGYARALELATSIYDAVLDRDMGRTESETLVKYMSTGTLNGLTLATDLLASPEFTARYGAVSNSRYVYQIYMNGLNRAPSLAEASTAVNQLALGTVTKAQLAWNIANSAEHHAIGGVHFSTNNTDLDWASPVQDRLLDKAEAAAFIERLVDTVYDRDATVNEKAALVDRLMYGTENLEDLATLLLAANGAMQGIYANSLTGLTAGTLVDQAFRNAVGRLPTATERQTWVDNLANNRLTVAQFIATISESGEHFIAGGTHLAGTALSLAALNGTGLNDTLTATVASYIQGLAGVDALTGSASSDKIAGGLGADILNGAGGSDNYEWSIGDGNDSITDATATVVETDTLSLLNVASSGVTLARSGANLLITIIATGEIITVNNRFGAVVDGQGIEAIAFSDSVTWNLATILAKTNTNGTAGIDTLTGTIYADNLLGLAGNDTLNGAGGADRLVGGLGVDTLDGGDGADIYEWATGDGSDIISDSSASILERDLLSLTNVDSTGVTLTRSGNNLVVTITSTGEVLTSLNRFVATSDGRGLEALKFSDGVLWALSDILVKTQTNGTAAADTLAGTAYNDNLFGFAAADIMSGAAGDDRLVGGLGVDTLDGGAGSDIYEWTLGDGNDIISDSSTSTVEQDSLVFTNVASSGVSLTRSGNNLIITITATTEFITDTNRFIAASNGAGLESIIFNDGVVWTLNDIMSRSTTNGTAGVDTITGTALIDRIFGLAGNDVINAGDGDDIISGGIGADAINGGLGIDTADYSASTAGVTVTLAITTAQTSTGDASGDTLTGVENLTGTALADTLTGSAIANVLDGGMGNDLLYGGAGADVMFGGDGNDTLQGGLGADYMDGGTGTADKADFTDTAAVVTVNLLTGIGSGGSAEGDILVGIENLTGSTTIGSNFTGNNLDNTLWGGSGVDVFYGLAGADNMWSFDGNDQIYGGSGDDTLNGGLGADYLDGGEGSDFVYYTTSTAAVVISLAAGTASGGDATGDTLVNIEKIFATSYDDSLTGDQFNNSLYGNSGNDTLNGGAGDDYLNGDTGNDIINGGDGNDTIIGSTGMDQMTGGNGIDTLNYAGSPGAITVNLATNTVSGGDATGDTISGFENIAGSNGDDFLTGDAGVNNIDGYIGNDTIDGGAGADIISGGGGTNTVTYANSSAAVQVVVTDNYVITQVSTGDASGDTLSYIQNITGSNFGDTLTGSATANVLTGGGGGDILKGLGGNDTLIGGAGNDSFLFGVGAGKDTITDFTAGIGAGDVINLLLGTAFDTFAEVLAVSTQVGADTQIVFGLNDIITLSNVQKTLLVADDFSFT